jgi:regulator of sigma D
MKVETRTTNFRPVAMPMQTRNVRRAQSFTGSPAQAVEKAAEKLDVDGLIADLIPNKRALQIMKKFETLKGEAGGILITALGTGIVAPIVIGSNPLVKAKPGATEDEKKEVSNKKWYTAWRQPISAILAVFFQLGAQKPIDKFLDKKFNDPKLSKGVFLPTDQCAVRGESYLKGLVKEDLAKKGNKKPSWFEYITNNKEAKAQQKKYKEAFDESLKAMQDEDIARVADNLKVDGSIKIGERVLDNPTLATLVNRTIDDSIAVARDLRLSESDMKHYSKKAEMLMNNEAHIREIFKNVPKDSKELEKFLQNALANEANPAVQELLSETLKKSPELRYSRISRTLERMDYIAMMCGGKEKFNRNKYIDAMSKRNGILDKIITNLNLNKIENTKKATKEQIQEAINDFITHSSFDKKNNLYKSILHDTEAFDFDKENLTKKIYEDIAKTYKKFVGHNYKCLNQVIKVCVGVFITLPITCTALNIIYPRFMDFFFPELSGKKPTPKKEEVEGGAK